MAMVKTGDTAVLEDAAIKDRVDAVGYLFGIGAWSDTTVKALNKVRDDPIDWQRWRSTRPNI